MHNIFLLHFWTFHGPSPEKFLKFSPQKCFQRNFFVPEFFLPISRCFLAKNALKRAIFRRLPINRQGGALGARGEGPHPQKRPMSECLKKRPQFFFQSWPLNISNKKIYSIKANRYIKSTKHIF